MRLFFFRPIILSVSFLFLGSFCWGQTPIVNYTSFCFFKSTSGAVEANEKEWAAIHKQLITMGSKAGWYLYKVKYPSGHGVTYDYVALNTFTDWKQVEAPREDFTKALATVYPNVDAETFISKTTQSSVVVAEDLFQLNDRTENNAKTPARYIIVNQVKSVGASEDQYVKLERTYFKPFHAARVEAGIMHSWVFYKRALPYGSKFDYDYVTFNGYATWADITRNNPEGLWKKVHGNVNFNEVHADILSKRATVNVELWELVLYVE